VELAMRGAHRLLLPATVLAAIAAPYALAVEDGTYRGTEDAGGNKVSLKVKDDKVVKFKATVNALCGSDDLLITVAYPPTGAQGAKAKIRNKSFKAAFKSDPSLTTDEDKRTISGRFTGSTVEGQIKVSGLCSFDGAYRARR
jgi:hypothetical protein